MDNKINIINSLSPDGSGRFIIMARILDSLYNNKDETINILDVGGGSPYISKTLIGLKSNYKLTSLDIIPKPKGYRGTYVQSDATNMPFKSGEFKVVISTDVLEHIPDDKKENFISECIRVANDYIIIAAPFNTEGVDLAEHVTNDFNKILFKEGQSWLEEHFENHKPEIQPLLNYIDKLGYQTEVIGSNNIYSWLLTTHANLMEAKLGLGKEKIKKANRFINSNLLSSGDMLPPYYRQFIIIFKTKKINSLKTQFNSIKIDHSITINYFHQILTIIADRIKKIKADSKRLEKTFRQELDLSKAKINNLEKELLEKNAIIESCRPYLSLKGSKILSILKKKNKV